MTDEALITEQLRDLVRIEVIGGCRLYNADCRKVSELFADAESVLMDPPYGIAYQSGWATDDLWKAGRSITGDADTNIRDEVVALFGNIPVLAFGSDRAPKPPGTRMTLIWDKGGALGMGAMDLPWKPSSERIYVMGKGFVGTRDCHDVLYHPPVQSMAKNGRHHPNEKPVGLLQMLLRKIPGTVCDPFMGSGSTGVACAKSGRKFIGAEIESKYFDIACERISKAYKQGDMFVEASP